jgi:hypothetical protein
MGWRFALVLSGVTVDATQVEPRPELLAADLRGIADLLVR